MKPPLRLWLTLLVVSLTLYSAPLTYAQAKSFYWERFEVDLTVLPNGDIRVVETQVINFTQGEFREGFATIDLDRVDDITDVTLSVDGVPYEREDDRAQWDDLKRGTYYATDFGTGEAYVDVVWNMGPTRNQSRTFELTYLARGVIRQYEAGNEFQWVAISPELHDAEIRTARVTVHLPAGVPVVAADYLIQPEFSTVPLTVETANAETAIWVAQRALTPSEGIHIIVQFPPNTIAGAPPRWQAEFDRETRWLEIKPAVELGMLALGLVLLAAVPLGLYLFWYWRGRDPDPGPIPEFITAPPKGLTPGIAGTLLDETVNYQDLVATLFDLARRGYLMIEELGNDFRMHKTTDIDTSALLDHERQLLKAVFSSDNTATFSGLNQHFYVNLERLQNQLYEDTVKLGFFPASPQRVRQSYQTTGLGLFILSIVGGVFLVPFMLGALDTAIGQSGTYVCPIMFVPALGVGLLILSNRMPVKTRQGAEAAELALAFRNYLTNLDKYAKPEEVADTFGDYLPYAIAFGLERSWVNRFAKVPATPVPGWYRMRLPPNVGQVVRPTSTPAATGGDSGGGAAPVSLPSTSSLSGGLQGISNNLNTMLNSAARVLTSTPPPANTSGGARSYSGGSSSSSRSSYRSSGSSFRSSSSSGRSSFRSSGGSGGGRRGFR